MEYKFYGKLNSGATKKMESDTMVGLLAQVLDYNFYEVLDNEELLIDEGETFSVAAASDETLALILYESEGNCLHQSIKVTKNGKSII